jgi:hypothetical protein
VFAVTIVPVVLLSSIPSFHSPLSPPPLPTEIVLLTMLAVSQCGAP